VVCYNIIGVHLHLIAKKNKTQNASSCFLERKRENVKLKFQSEVEMKLDTTT